MKIRVQGTSREEIINAGRQLGTYLRVSKGRGQNVWFGYGELPVKQPAPKPETHVFRDNGGYLQYTQ